MKKTIFLLLLAVLGLSVWHLRPMPTESADSWEDEALRVELKGRVELANFKLAAAGNVRGPEELAKVVSANQEREARIASLKGRRDQLTASLRQDEDNLVKFAADRLRELKERAIGKEWAELATAARTYQDVTVVAVTDAGVTIRHRDGSARLRFHDLTDGQRHEFGLDESAALAAVREERQKAIAYEQWLEDELAAMERNKLEAAKVFAQAARTRAVAAAPVVSANVAPVTKTSRLRESARQVGNTYYSSSYGRPRRSSFYYYYNAPRYCAPRSYGSYCAPRPYSVSFPIRPYTTP